MVMSTMMTSLAEGMSLSDRLGLDNDALIEVQIHSIEKQRSQYGAAAIGGEHNNGCGDDMPKQILCTRFGETFRKLCVCTQRRFILTVFFTLVYAVDVILTVTQRKSTERCLE